MAKYVEMDIIGGKSVYIDSYRVAGVKPLGGESIQTFNLSVDAILNSLKLEDIKKYVEKKNAKSN